MPASQNNIDANTPMGANLVPEGCTFRTWAPRANAVYVGGPFTNWQTQAAAQLVSLGGGHWGGFIPDVTDGTEYKFYVSGQGSEGWKRDPYARELSATPAYPQSNCIIRDPSLYPWHDQDFQPV